MKSLATGPRERGQAAVESAIVLPLYIFLLLGILQLGLMHQARLLTKYAAYKAVRAGALHNASVKAMEEAALGALLPMLSWQSNGVELIQPVTSGSQYATKFARVKMNIIEELPALKRVEVTICNPTKKILGGGGSKKEVEFDDLSIAGSGWKTSAKTKLAVQVTFNYRMPIPFANWVIHRISRGQSIFEGIRLGKKDVRNNRTLSGMYETASYMGVYVFPIRASYTMRMQSNIFLDKAPIPETNECVIPFPKKEGS